MSTRVQEDNRANQLVSHSGWIRERRAGHGHRRAMGFTRFGNASSTYAMIDTDVRGTLHNDYTIVRKGNIVAAFLEGRFSSVVASQFQSLVGKGVSKLS